MKKILLFFVFCFSVTLVFSQQKFNRELTKDTPSGKQQKLEIEIYYEALDGSKQQITPDQILVQFKEGVSISTQKNVLESTGKTKNVSEKTLSSYINNIVVVDTKGIQDVSELETLVKTLNANNKVKFAHVMYKGTGDTNQAALDNVIVKLKSPADLGFLQAKANQLGATIQARRTTQNAIYFVQASQSSDYDAIDLARKLNDTKRFEYAEANFLMTNLTSNTNDPEVGDQWGLNNTGSNNPAGIVGTADVDINAFEAWSLATGAGIKIAIVDEGTDPDHPDLDVLPGYDASGGGSGGAPTGNDAHGTACGGIAAAIGDNGTGVAGVAYHAQIIPIRFLVGGSGTTADAIDAIYWAVDEGDADVISNSWGGGGFSQALLDALEHCYETGRGGLGTLNFCATGNGNSGVDYPAKYDSDAVIAVGAMNMCGERKSTSSCDNETWWGSNWGDEIDVVAPSPKVVTTDISGSAGYTGGDYTYDFNGTSAATPYAAGVGALVLSANPVLSAAETRVIIESTCRKLGDYDYADDADHPNGTWDAEVGHGMVNAFDAVALADSGPVVIIAPSSQSKTVVEAEGCAIFTDYEFNVSILGEYTGTDDPIVTVAATGGSAVSPDDFTWESSTSVSFTSGMAETQTVTIRIYNDLVTEGDETIDFAITLDAGNTDAVLSGNSSFTSTTWTVQDAPIGDELPGVSFTEDALVDAPSCAGLQLELEIRFDNWPEETSWEITDASNTVVAEGGPYGSEPDQSTINIPITLTSGGDYTFTIYDSWGDGILQQGYYELTSGGVIIAEGGGNFGSSESHDFCVTAGSTFNGILPLEAVVSEIENCGDDYAEYVIAMNISQCVYGEQDITATIVVMDGTTATEGTDFLFPDGKVVTFNGQDAQTLLLPIRFLSDGELEGNETIKLGLEIDNTTIAEVVEVHEINVIIVDADTPALTMSAPMEVNEADYSCDANSNTFTVEVTVDEGCATLGDGVTLTLATTENSIAQEGDDFNFVGSNSFLLNDSYDGEPIVFTIEVFDDGVIEGMELLEFTLNIDPSNLASLETASTMTYLYDPQGVTPPSITSLGIIDFEDGLPEGWSTLVNLDDAPNGWTISDNTGLDGKALHISSDPLGSQVFEYVSSSPTNDLFLISPPFGAAQATPWDFFFQVQGEPGFFGAFDFGFAGLVDGTLPIDDPAALIGSLYGYQLLGVPAPTQFSSLITDPDLNTLYANGGFDGPVRLVFLWRNDFSIDNNPPLGLDNIDLSEVYEGNYIETNVMIEDEIPSYPINAGDDTYYYNLLNDEIAMMVNSSSDHGCSSGYVVEQGEGVTQFISEYDEDFRAKKSFAVETENPDEDASLTMGLYFTEAEIAGWEEGTGRDRSELHMFKTMGYKLAGCCTEVEVNITPDNFPGETSWDIVDSDGSEIASGGAESAVVIVPNGSYTFTIYDSFGDGICCAWGEGSYSLVVNGEEIASGGDFDDSESVRFEAMVGEELDLCHDYRDIEFAPVTLVPYANGYRATASFGTGLADITGFGVAGLPAFSPGEFTAVQNEEQVDITFENKYGEDRIEYFIFEELSRDLEWVELETVPADGSGSYMVVDFFPYVGINRYRVAAIMTNGDRLYPCYEAEVFYESTNDFDVSPNPASNHINIVISDGDIEGQLDLGIYDERGRLVMSQDLISYAGVTRYNVDISSLAVGQYYIRVAAENGRVRHATFIKVEN